MILCFDSFFRLNTVCFYCCYFISILHFILFYLAVILFRFICSPLSNVPLQHNQCYHHVIQSCAFSGFQCFHARVAICPDESLLSVGWNVGVVFTFTTVERRLLLMWFKVANKPSDKIILTMSPNFSQMPNQKFIYQTKHFESKKWLWIWLSWCNQIKWSVLSFKLHGSHSVTVRLCVRPTMPMVSGSNLTFWRCWLLFCFFSLLSFRLRCYV